MFIWLDRDALEKVSLCRLRGEKFKAWPRHEFTYVPNIGINDRRDEQFLRIDRRFDEMMDKPRGSQRKHEYFISRRFRVEIEVDELK